MTSHELKIASDFALPVDIAVTKLAVLAKSGAGKTHAASVIAEEMDSAGVRFVALDPVGVWWGLRVGVGKRAGRPVVLFGADSESDGKKPAPDVVFRETDGERIADLLVAGSFSAVIDLSALPSKSAEKRFIAALASRLYRRNRRPLHLFLDEADYYAPEKPRGEDTKSLGAITDIVRRGRARGLGVTLISQRSASLAKDVLTQLDTLIVMRTIAPQDRNAIQDWIRAKATNEERDRVFPSLASLKTGQAWVWSPDELKLLQLIQFRMRHTFDSSATPKVGQIPVARGVTRSISDVDIAGLQAALVVEEEEKKGRGKKGAKDAAALTKRIKELEHQLRVASTPRPAAPPPPPPPPKIVEVPALDAATKDELKSLMVTAREANAALGKKLVELHEVLVGLHSVRAVKLGEIAEGRFRAPSVGRVEKAPKARERAPSGADKSLYKGQRDIVSVLAAAGTPLKRSEVALLSVMVPSSGTFGNYIGALKNDGYIDSENGELVVTAKGLSLATDARLPTSAELVARWSDKGFYAGTRRILMVLMGAFPEGVTRDELASRSEHVASSGTFGNYVGKLTSTGLAEKRGGLYYASQTLYMGDK